MQEAERTEIRQQLPGIDDAFKNYSPELKNLCVKLLSKDPK